MRILYLYTTSACHLCDLAEQWITPFLNPCDLKLELVDIADSEELMENYGVRIPVLKIKRGNGTHEELAWPFNVEQLEAYLKGQVAQEFLS